MTLSEGCAGRKRETVERGDVDGGTRVLIAFESSEFKRTVAEELLGDLESSGHYVNVMDLDAIDDEELARYDAIVLLNALEMMTLDASVRGLLKDPEGGLCKRVVLVTTTSHDNWSFFHKKPVAHGVDVITAASKKANVDPVVKELVAKVERIVAARHQ